MVSARFTNITEPLSGFIDAIGEDVRTMRYVQNVFAELFAKWGYEEINVPIVERASSFSEEVIGGSPWPEWDKRGVFYLQLQSYEDRYSDLPLQEPALLVPEGTISVSRWLAREIEHERLTSPKKIFYIMPCFRNELISKLSQTKGRQFHQAGVEILGTNSVTSDLEVLTLAHKGFEKVGVQPHEILVRIGSVGLFNKVCAESKLAEADILLAKDLMDTIAESRAGKQPERLEPCIDQLFDLLSGYHLTKNLADKWKIMARTHVATLQSDFTDVVGYKDEVDNLNYLATRARAQGINCIIDPSVVRSHEYYTGIVYELDIRIEGSAPLVEVAGGGRYNKLVGKFLGEEDNGLTIPAVGFAYGLERVISIRNRLKNDKAQRSSEAATLFLGSAAVDVVLCGTSIEIHDRVLEQAALLREAGKRVDVYVGDDSDPLHLARYAEAIGADLITIG